MMNDWHFTRVTATANAEPSHLWPQIIARDNALAAWDKVRRNNGAPGVDGVSIRDLAPCFEQEWKAVDTALRRGVWQPQPVRRVSVPKSGGGVRYLGIPTVMDRVVHQAISQVLTPPWERRFSSRSFAYRRGLGAREALTCLASQAHACGTADAWHLDIREFFDSVPHDQALRAVRRVADEPELLHLVQSILTAGVFADGRVRQTTSGIPQGSPLSPLLANGVLHHVDLWLTQQELPFVRYADDIVILLPPGHTVEQWSGLLVERLSHLGLILNDQKTTHGPLSDLSFLGFGFFRDACGQWRRRISPTAWQSLESELSRRTSVAWSLLGEDEGSPADYFHGWLSHFGITECPQDQQRLAALALVHRSSDSGWLPPGNPKVRVAYDGTSQGGAKARRATSTAFPVRHGWPRTLRLWVTRALARRWVRIGLDWGGGKRGLPLRAIRLSIGPFNFRFHL